MNNDNESRGLFAQAWELLLRIGLGESILRAGTMVLSVLMIGVVIWLVQAYFAQPAEAGSAAPMSGTEAVSGLDGIAMGQQQNVNTFDGIPRVAQPFTTIPTRPRERITKYVVVEGDTVFGIAEQFGLKPETILWGNYNILLDNPHSLKPGQELLILPADGVYWQWIATNKGGLPAFANFFGASADDILNSPVNELDLVTVGDINAPNILDGTWLFVPGGARELISWSAPLGVTRENPASARMFGPGVCDPVSGGAVGYGTFIWPTISHILSGYDYTSVHRGIDIHGVEGEPLFASDAGVIVYAGWNNYGYGNLVMIDHGGGFQSLYAHMSAIGVGCGQSVGQGDVIGALGTTGNSSGPHLHFEILSSFSGRVNPWDVLPPP